MQFKELDPILHSPLRLAVVSLLMGVKTAEFTYIRDATQATAGNLSVQLSKLKEAGYIDIEKKFHKNYPQTICKITPKGVEAFEKYVASLKQYLEPATQKTTKKKESRTDEEDDLSISPVLP